MLYSTIVVSYLFSFILCLGDIVLHTPVGVIHEASQTNDAGEAGTVRQEGVLRRRLLPGGFSSSDKITILNQHNTYRQMTALGKTPNQPSAQYMNSLVWDADLAKVAQNYSQQCIWAHNPNRNTQVKSYSSSTSFSYVNQYIGENLFISTGTESISTILDGIKYWYNEYQYFTYGTVSGTGTCVSGVECGHYTQLVWANTRYVGCGYTKCATVKNLASFTNAILFACDYYFAGNWVGDYPYVSGSSCSNCPHDRQTCQNGTCTGCPNPSYDTYCCEYCSTSNCATTISNGGLNSPSTCTNGITSTNLMNEVNTITPSPTLVPTPTPTPRPTTQSPTTGHPTTQSPTTGHPTTQSPTTGHPTTAHPTTTTTTTKSPSTAHPTATTTKSPTTAHPTAKPTTAAPTKSTTSKQCCMAYNSVDTAICSILGSTLCQSTLGCYWDVSC